MLVSSNWWINWLLQLCYSFDLKLPTITGSVLFSICFLFEYEFVKLKLWKIAKFRIKFKWSAKEEIRVCARDFRVSIHWLALNRQSLNSQFLSAGREKTSKKTLF